MTTHELTAVACSCCGATGVRIDLDVRQTPPDLVCLKCKRKPKCSRCAKRRGRLGSRGVCLPCERKADADSARYWMRTCTCCQARIDITETNDHGECGNCAISRLYAENPIR